MTGLENPQNPYQSFAVIASAGSGKTFQLSRRVLSLVGAGADVSSILGITFTQKAALEMRERIILDAAKLSHDKKFQDEFDEQMNLFYKPFAHGRHKQMAPPRSGAETARLILSQSCQIRMSTMDSCFLMWARKYYFNRFFALANDRDLEILNPQALNQLIEQALEDCLEFALSTEDGQSLVQTLGVTQVKRLLSEWLSRVQGLDAAKTGHPDFYFRSSSFDPSFDASRLWADISQPLSQIGAELDRKFAEPIERSIAELTIQYLTDSGLVRQDGTSLSGTYLRGKKKETLATQITTVNDYLGQLDVHRKISWLLQTGLSLHHLGLYLREKIMERQSELCALTFSDITQAAKDLFTSSDFSGERYLVHLSIKHLLLDEFQDTSRIQYDVLESLSHELLAGEGVGQDSTGLRPSLFIVGDTKQAIYGFRNADASLLEEASEALAQMGLVPTSLNASYRSTRTVMEFCNAVFPGLMENYIHHTVALTETGEEIHPDVSSITLVESVVTERDQQLGRSAQAVEAQDLARFLAQVFSKPELYPVYDKQSKQHRRMRYSDCAILFRTGTHAQTLLSALKKAQIPARLEGDQDFWNSLIVSDLLAWFRYLVDPQSVSLLFRTLKSYYSPLSDEQALNCFKAADTSQFIRESIADEDFKEFLAAHRLLYNEGSTPYTVFLKFRAFLIRSLQKNLEPEIAEQFFNRLSEFELWLSDLDRRGVHSLTQLLQESYESPSVLMEESKSDSVVVMSIHKSKGLEYPMVCLVHSDKKWEKRDSYWVRAKVPAHDPVSLQIHERLAFIGNADDRPKVSTDLEQLLESIDIETREESKRLLYVALTRARQYLVVSAIPAGPEEGANPLYASMLSGFSELVNLPGYLMNEYPVSADSEAKIREVISPKLASARTTGIIENYPDLGHASKSTFQVGESRVSRTPLYILSPSEDAENQKLNSEFQGKVENKETSGFTREQAKILGTVLHAAVEQVVKDRAVAQPEWNRLLSKHDPFGLLHLQHQETLQKNYEACVQSSEFATLLNESQHLYSEYSFVRVVGQKLVQGSMDLVAVFHDRIDLIDFKTGEDFNEHLEGYRKQMHFYRQALEQGFGRQKLIACKLFWIHEGKLTVTELKS